MSVPAQENSKGKEKVKGWGVCDYCGRYVRHTSYNRKKWGHISSIPIIPFGPRVRILKSCNRCFRGHCVRLSAVPALIDELRKKTEKAVDALLEGGKEFEDNGKMVSPLACLADAVDTLHCLQEDKHLDALLEKLEGRGLMHAYHLILGESLEFQGRLEEAVVAYGRAAAFDSTDPISRKSLGVLHMKRKDYQSARDNYLKALNLTKEKDKLPIFQALFTIYRLLGDDARLIDTYENCFNFRPELATDRTMLRAYRWACRRLDANRSLNR